MTNIDESTTPNRLITLLPAKRGGFDKQVLPLGIFLVVVSFIPIVGYRGIRPALQKGLGLDVAQIWPRLLGTVLGGALLFLLAVSMFRWERISITRIGGSRRHTLWGLVWFVGIVAVLNGLLLVAATAIADRFEFATAGLSPLVWVGVAATNWLFVGLAEELVARAYLQNKLVALFDGERRLGRRTTAVVVASLLFALWHIPQRLLIAGLTVDQLPASLAQVAVLGLVLGLVYEVTQNVVLVGLLHGAWDFPPIFLSVYSNQTWQGIVLLLVIVLPFVLGVGLYWRLASATDRIDVPS